MTLAYGIVGVVLGLVAVVGLVLAFFWNRQPGS